MTERLEPDEVLRLFDEGVDGFVVTAEGLGPRGWGRPACGTWSAAELARHVLAVARWYHEWLDRAEAGDAAAPFAADELAVRNAAALEELAGLDGATAVVQFAERTRAYRDRLRAAWDLPFGYPRGTVTAGLHAGVAAPNGTCMPGTSPAPPAGNTGLLIPPRCTPRPALASRLRREGASAG